MIKTIVTKTVTEPSTWELAPMGWDAIATIVAGLIAVYAAYRVGKRQLAITERQNRVAEMALKAELFDRRFAIYDTAMTLLDDVLTPPSIPTDRAKFVRLMEAVHSSRFLFDDLKIHETLLEIQEKAFSNYSLRTTLRLMDPTNPNYQERNIQFHESHKWLAEKQQTLHEIFYNDLKLELRFAESPKST
jgi:hypothetical protein